MLTLIVTTPQLFYTEAAAKKSPICHLSLEISIVALTMTSGTHLLLRAWGAEMDIATVEVENKDNSGQEKIAWGPRKGKTSRLDIKEAGCTGVPIKTTRVQKKRLLNKYG